MAPETVILLYHGSIILILLVMTGILLPNWRRSGALFMILINLAFLLWTVSDLICRFNCHGAFQWDAFAYIGITSIPPLLLLLTLDYVGIDTFLKKRIILPILLIIPLLTVCLAFTNGSHGLVWQTITPIPVGTLTAYERTYGQYFGIQMAYSYALVAVSAVIQGIVFTRTPRHYRLQALLLLLATLIPIVSNGIHIALNPLPGMDPTLMGGAIGAIIYTVIILKWLGIRVYYLANLTLLNEFNSMMLLIDPNGKIAYVTGAARNDSSLTALQEKHLSEVLTPRQVDEVLATTRTARIERILIGDNAYEANIAPVRSARNVIEGWVILLRDVTLLKEAVEYEEKQNRLNAALITSIAAINSTLELSEVLDTILETLDDILPSDASNVMLIEDGSKAYIEHSRGYEALGFKVPHGNRHRYHEIPNLERMILSRRPVIISDTETDPRWVEGDFSTWQKSYAGVPMISHDEVIGFLNLNSSASGSYTEEHSDVLMLFAGEAALAITNARLYDSVRRYSHELEQRNDQLDAFAHTIAHDLRAPLQLVQGYLSLLDMEVGTSVADELKVAISDMQNGAQRMERLIRGLLLMATDNGQQQLERVEIAPMIAALIDQFRVTSRITGIALSVEGELPPSMGIPTWLESAFGNLIDNAIKYIGLDNPDPRVVIRGWREGNTCHYEVSDNGVGMTEKQLAALFTSQERFGNAAAEGYGLGLSIVYRIISRLGGKITAASEPGKGSTFTVTLPAAD